MALVVKQEDAYATGKFDGSYILDTEFARKEATNSDNLRPWALTNKIHPLFHPQRFPSTIDYKVIEQPARLASHFLTCGVLDSFWSMLRRSSFAWMHESEPTDLSRALHGTAYSTAQCAKDPIEEDRNGGALFALAHLVEFLIDHGDVWGAKTAQTDVTHSGVGATIRHRGYKNQVMIGEQTYKNLANATNDSPQDTPRLMLLQFEFAIMLTHEVGHCWRNAFSGRVDFEPFFGWSSLAEVGFEIEKRLFGGHITRLYDGNEERWYSHDGQVSGLEGMIVLYEYPYQGILKDYQRNLSPGEFCSMQNRGEPKDRRPLDLAWRIEITWFQKLFQDNFWQTEFPQQGQISLWPRRHVGYCFRIYMEDGWPIRCAVKKAATKEEGKKYLPIGYIREAVSGVIRPSKKLGAPKVSHPPEWEVAVDRGPVPGHVWINMGYMDHRLPDQQTFPDLMKVRRRVLKQTENGKMIFVVYKDPETGKDVRSQLGFPYEW